MYFFFFKISTEVIQVCFHFFVFSRPERLCAKSILSTGTGSNGGLKRVLEPSAIFSIFTRVVNGKFIEKNPRKEKK